MRTSYTIPNIYSLKQKPKTMKAMNSDKKVMRDGISPQYKFSTHNHYEIIDILEKNRIHYNITKYEFSAMAGYKATHYSSLAICKNRFSRFSFKKYRDLIVQLNSKENPEPVYAPTEPTPTKDLFELTEEVCINFLKATGNYKISKSEVTTNWIEL